MTSPIQTTEQPRLAERPAITGLPELSSERLTLSAAIDPDQGARVFLRPGAARFIGASPSPESLFLSVSTMMGHWALRGYGHFVVRRKDTGTPIGLVGPWYPQGWPEPELSWHLVEGHEAQGFATEAASTVRDWLFDAQGWTRLVSLIEDGNTASAQLAERLGAKPDGTAQTQTMGTLQVWRYTPPTGGDVS